MKLQDISEAKYYRQREIYIHNDGGVPVEIIKWDKYVTIRDLETGEEHVYSEDVFNYKFRKREESDHLDWSAFDTE